MHVLPYRSPAAPLAPQTSEWPQARRPCHFGGRRWPGKVHVQLQKHPTRAQGGPAGAGLRWRGGRGGGRLVALVPPDYAFSALTPLPLTRKAWLAELTRTYGHRVPSVHKTIFNILTGKVKVSNKSSSFQR